jgi:hypothetical protein
MTNSYSEVSMSNCLTATAQAMNKKLPRAINFLPNLMCLLLLMAFGIPRLSAYDVTFQPLSSTASEQGEVNGTCRLSRIGTSGALDVNIQIAVGSTATLTTDYNLQWFNTGLSTPAWVSLGTNPADGSGAASSSGIIRFLDGEAAVDIRLVPEDETDVEGREYVLVNIVSNPAVYNSGPIVTQRFTIADDDHKGRIEVIQPIADEDIALRGDPDDPFSRRRGIVRVQFNNFPDPVGTGNYLTNAFSRNLSVQFFSAGGNLPAAALGSDYAIKYKTSGHSNDVETTDIFSQIGRVNNPASGLSTTTGINYRLMAALPGDDVISLQEQDSEDLQTTNTIPVNAVIYFESDPTKRAYLVTASGPSAITISPVLNRSIPNATKIKVLGVPANTSAPDSVIVERVYPSGAATLGVGEGFGRLFEGDVIQIEGDSLTYVITQDPVMLADANGRGAAYIDIFAFEGGNGGGILVEQTTAAKVSTMVTPTINSEGIMQLLIPKNATKLEISIEPVGAGDGAEGAEAVRMRMIADEDYIIESPQDTQVTIADRDVIAGVSVDSSAGLPNIQGAFRFSISKAYTRAIEVPFLLTDTAGDTSSASTKEGTTFNTIARKVTFTAGQTSVLLPIIPIDDGDPLTPAPDPTSIKITLLGSEDYKLGGSSSSSFNPSATMHINDVSGTTSIAATTATAVESSTPVNGLFTISVARLSGTAPVPLRLTVTGTAVNASRYEFFNPSAITQTYQVVAGELNQLTIPSGQNSVQIGVRPIDNQVADGIQTVQLSLNNQGMSYAIGAPNTATVTITDNEPTIFVTLVSDAARPATPGTFRFSYPGVPVGTALGQAVTVNFSYDGATNNVDFQGATSVTIQPNTRSADLTITPTVAGTADSLTVKVLDSSSKAYNIGTPDSATMSFSDAPENVPNNNKTTPGSVSSGASGGGCGLGSGIPAFALFGLFALYFVLRRREV